MEQMEDDPDEQPQPPQIWKDERHEETEPPPKNPPAAELDDNPGDSILLSTAVMPLSMTTLASTSTAPSLDAEKKRDEHAKLQIALKMLVSNNVAGSIIGKAGQTISELQRMSDCRIKLSKANNFFPGTSDRVCLLQGENCAVQVAIRMLLAKFRPQTSNPRESSEIADDITADRDTTAEIGDTANMTVSSYDDKSGGNLTVRLLVPSSACGMLIGRGGSHIKSIAEKSHARMQLTQKEELASVATSERIVTITGDMSACVTCVELVLDAMAWNQELYKYSNMTTSYANAVAASAFGQAGGYLPSSPIPGIEPPPRNAPDLYDLSEDESRSRLQDSRDLQSNDESTTIQIAIPDSLLGAIIGRGGSVIAELQLISGARIKISDRGEFVPGTTNRIVIITGSAQSCATARLLVTQKMTQQIQPVSSAGEPHRRRRNTRRQGRPKGGEGEDAPPPSEETAPYGGDAPSQDTEPTF